MDEVPAVIIEILGSENPTCLAESLMANTAAQIVVDKLVMAERLTGPSLGFNNAILSIPNKSPSRAIIGEITIKIVSETVGSGSFSILIEGVGEVVLSSW